MREQDDLSSTGSIDEASDIGHEVLDAVAVRLGGTGGAAVAALVGGPDAVAHSGEEQHLLAPAKSNLWKAVKAEDERLARAAGQDLKVEPIGADELGLDRERGGN